MTLPKAVVLLSGGMDSATVAAIALRDGYEVYALSVRYGQRHAVELAAARRVAERLGVRRHVRLDLDLRAFGGSASGWFEPAGARKFRVGANIHDDPVLARRL